MLPPFGASRPLVIFTSGISSNRHFPFCARHCGFESALPIQRFFLNALYFLSPRSVRITPCNTKSFAQKDLFLFLVPGRSHRMTAPDV